MRDLVQFVPFSKFENDEKKLSMEVLEEIPRQIVDYYTINNLEPNKIRQLISQNNKNDNKIEYPQFDFDKAEFDWDKVPIVESVSIDLNKMNAPKEVHVSMQKDNEKKTYTNQPSEYPYYNNDQKDNNNYSVFNKNNL